MEKIPTVKNELGMTPEEFADFIEGIGAGDDRDWSEFLKLGSHGQKILQNLIKERAETLAGDSLEKKAAQHALERIEAESGA